MLAAASPSDSAVVERVGFNGLRERLKRATTPAHHALDIRFSAFDLTTRSGYLRFLEASAAAVAPLEEALERAGVLMMFEDWPQRSRRAAIAADIDCLGGAIRPLPDIGALTRNQVIGALYVLEGSRLGARYLLKKVLGSAGPPIAGATRYLRHGADQHLWRSFLEALAREIVAPGEEADIVAGAHRAFAVFAAAAARA
jgi:heme oxygenase (biliverdin-IX-beta and delta-forming)